MILIVIIFLICFDLGQYLYFGKKLSVWSVGYPSDAVDLRIDTLSLKTVSQWFVIWVFHPGLIRIAMEAFSMGHEGAIGKMDAWVQAESSPNNALCKKQ